VQLLNKDETILNAMTVFHLINLFFAGILAGMEIAIHYGLHAPPKF